jgi:4-hydroxybenzoate polyprenyltransferase
MIAAPVIGGLAVGTGFAALTAICVLLSVAYSHPRCRWKSRPGLDLLVNVLGYGAGTTLAGWLAGTAATAAATAGGVEANLAGVSSAPWLIVGGFGLLFASLYPLTQIYQIADDRLRGDRTLATALGGDTALVLAVVGGLAAAVALLLGAVTWRWAMHGTVPTVTLSPLAVALTAWLAHLGIWWRGRRVWDVARQRQGMYHALALWAAVDLGLLITLYWQP